MRIVLDTSVVVSAFRNRMGASARVLRLALTGAIEVAASPPVFLEYEAVLRRDDQLSAHGQSIEQIDVVLTVLSRRIIPVDIYFQWKPQLPDPDDEMILEAAINGRADAIATHNLRHFLPVAPRFGIRVLSPSQFLLEVKS